MKKSMLVLLAAILILCVLTACGGNGDVKNTDSKSENVSQVETGTIENGKNTERPDNSEGASEALESFTPSQPAETDTSDVPEVQVTTDAQETEAPTEIGRNENEPIELPFVPAG